MNSRGKAYVTEVNKRFNLYKKTMLASNNKWVVPHWSWTSPPVQERLMRIGVEIANFDIDHWDVEELEAIAIASVKEDYLNRFNQFYYQSYVVQSLPKDMEDSIVEDSFRLIKTNNESTTCIVECMIGNELTNQYRWKTYIENRAICIPIKFKETKK